MRVAVVPAKGFAEAKGRLAGALTPGARRALAEAMLEDVLAALVQAGLDEIVVVTPDPETAGVARRAGVTLLEEPEACGHTAAVALGLAHALGRGARVLLTVPGDLPLLTAEEVRAILAALGPAPAAVFVPSRNGLGTNAACLTPPEAVPLRFGEPSFADHLAAARARGIEPVVLELPGAALDLDGPEDLALLLEPPGVSRTLARLRALGVRLPASAARPPRLEVIGVAGLPEVRPGDDLGRLIVEAARDQGTPLQARDILVVSQKVVSKAEGRLVRLEEVVPSPVAEELARGLKRDPRLVEVILRESRRIVRMDKGILITETHHGWICANAGVDQSNLAAGVVSCLPLDPDASARRLVERVHRLTGLGVAAIVADTFGRPWREGLTNVAIGVAGLAPLRSYLGMTDPAGYTLQATLLAAADELAGAAELVMGKVERVPVAVVRGYPWEPSEAPAQLLIRPPERDLFR